MQSKIILASASPRRIEILKNHGVEAEVIPADIDESTDEATPPHILCMYNALKKALNVYERVSEGIIIAADTIVYCEGVIGKPMNEEAAFKTLSMLRGRTHSVYSGVALIDVWTGKKTIFFDRTDVTFTLYSDEDIRAYIATGEPMDKAGSYAIQGEWARFVSLTVGDFSNVVGLPWKKLETELKRFDKGIES
ncbi:MAG: Maf family protein [Anaerovoracaceae bacterium]